MSQIVHRLKIIRKKNVVVTGLDRLVSSLFICYKNFHISGSYRHTGWMGFKSVWRY